MVLWEGVLYDLVLHDGSLDLCAAPRGPAHGFRMEVPVAGKPGPFGDRRRLDCAVGVKNKVNKAR